MQILLQVSGDDDEEYELTVVSYSAPTHDTRDEPGDGGEVDFAHTVSRLMCGREVEEIAFDDFLARYAEYYGLSREGADSRIRTRAMCEVAEKLDADYADSLESALEDR